METDQYSLNLVEIFRVFKLRIKTIILIVGFFGIVSVVVSLLWPIKYVSEASILPITSFSDSGKGLGGGQGLEAMAAILGMQSGATSSANAKLLISILKSRTIHENVIQSQNLLPVLFSSNWDSDKNTWKSGLFSKAAPTLEDGVRKVKRTVFSVEEGKKYPFFLVKVKLPTSKLANDVLQAYLVELQTFLQKNTLTMSKKNRIYIEEQLDDRKMQFLKIGKDLSEFYQKFRVSNSNGQISVRAEFEKSSSLPLLQKVETVPQNVYYEYLKSQQALMGSVVNLLSTKRELAKIEEDKESISFQILDSPSMPNRRDEPKRAIICLIGLLLGTMMALAYCIFDYHVKSILESERTKSV